MEPETRLAPAPPALPSKLRFVFLNDRGLRAGWRFLIFLFLLAPISFASLAGLGLLLHALYGPGPLDFAFSAWPIFLEDLARLIPVVLATWIMSRIEHRPAGVYGLPLQRSAVSGFILGYLAWGFLPLTVVLLIMRLLGVFSFGAPGLRLPEALYWAGAWGVAFLCVGLFEEYLARGYALWTLADGIGFWPAAILMALLFGWGHMGNPGETKIGITGTILFALFAAATLRRTGSLWLAVGAHAGWNWGQSYFYGVNNSGMPATGHLLSPPPPPHGPLWLSGGTVGPEGSIVTLIVWGLMFAGFLVFYKPRPHELKTDR
jgi:uncharacterized protein